MKFSMLKTRTILLVAIFLAIMVAFGVRLMQMQIVDGEEYLSQISQGTQKTQRVKAARGEIVDRYGRPFAVNQVGFNVVLDRAFLAAGSENEIILRLTDLLTQSGESWIDNLPITQSEPFTFLEDRDEDVAKLKKYVNVNEYATADYVMHWLIEEYGLEEYTSEEARILAGVRYEMVQKDFSYITPYVFATDISIETATKIKEHSYELLGADIEQTTVREYPTGTIAPHVIGITGPIYENELAQLGEGYNLDDTVGKSGIELALESELRGTDGTREIFINSSGEVVDVIETKSPEPGNTVVTTIDKNLQSIAQEALQLQIEYLQTYAEAGKGKEAFAGAAVAIDVKTGEILVAASYPGYDLNTYYDDYSTLAADTVNNALYNRAFQGTYTPGSIFKPATALAGLATGVIDANSTVYCGQVYTRFPDYPARCLSMHRDINVVRALQESCNIFFYDVGYRAGIENIDKYAMALGLGVNPNIDILMGDQSFYSATGTLSSPELSASRGEIWNPGDVIQSAIGQFDNKFSPIQLASYCATIANRGTRMRPTLVRSIESYDMSQTIREHEPTVVSQLEEDPSVFDPIIQGMVNCARIGSGSYYSGYLGKTFADYEIDVACKTGTPETAQFPNSTFIAYAPVDDPQIAVAVVIEKGWHGYTGIPVARAIFDGYFYSQVSSETPQQSGQLLP